MTLTLRSRLPAHVVTEPVTFTVPTKRHGSFTFTGTLLIINDFSYTIELREFPDLCVGTESPEEAIEMTTDALIRILEKRSLSYWRRLDITPDRPLPL